MKNKFLSALIFMALIFNLLIPTTARAASTNTTVDSVGDVGQYTSLALQSNGFPIVSYYDFTNNNLKLAVCGNESCTSKTITTVDATANTGAHNSLVLNGSGFPVISYVDGGNDLKVAICDNLICTTKTLTVVDSTSIFSYTSLALNGSGFPVISYYDASNLDLKVAVCGNAACSSGNAILTIDSLGVVGGYTSLALNGSGFPVISYYDATNSNLKTAVCGNATCSSGNILTVIDSLMGGGHSTSLKLNGSGFPVISYYSNNLKVATCGNATCSSGNTLATVDSPAGTTVGKFSSLALNGVSGFPVISYSDTSNYNLKTAVCGNAACSSGNTILTIDSLGVVGQYTSLALNASGFPIISYYDTTNGDLKVAVKDDLTPPSVVSFTYKNPATSPTNADGLVFQATFSEAVTGVDTADFKTSFLCGETVTNVFQVTTSTYNVSVTGGSLATCADLTVELSMAGSPTITDLSGNPLPNGSQPPTSEVYLMDNYAPGETTFSRKTPATSLTNADGLVFLVTFNEAVTGVDMADFTANTSSTATVTNVTQVNSSSYDVTISGGNLAGFNGTVNLNFSGAQNITDEAGNALPAGEPLVTDQTYTLDNTAPSITSFTLLDPVTSPTGANTLVFRATFSESVTGVAMADFTANTSSTATVTGVTMSTTSSYDVTISGGNLAGFNGTVNLNLSGTPTITDEVGNALPAGEPVTDQTYLIVNAPPSVTSFTLFFPAVSPTNADTLVFLVTFSEDVTGVDAADFVKNTTSTAAIIGITSVTPSTYNVTISGGNLAGFNGTVNLNLSGAPTITNLSGNALLNGEPPIDQTFTVENIAPSLISFTLKTPATSPTNADTLVFRATFSEAVTGVATGDFLVNSSSAATVSGVTQVTTSAYDVTVSGGNLLGFNGTVNLNLSGAQNITDVAGNALPIGEPLTDQTYTIVNSASTWTVTKLADTNDNICFADCSLREAVSAAWDGDTILFAPGVIGVSTLSGTEIYISKSITITGPGASLLVIDGNNASRIFEMGNKTVSISGMTLTKGKVTGASSGGAIYNSGTLNIASVNFENNTATAGGAVFSNYASTLTITNAVFENNTADSGGALIIISSALYQSHLTLEHVTVKNNFAANYAGGIEIGSSAVVTISASVISGNTVTNAGGSGGGLWFGGNGNVTFNNVTISGNSANGDGGGILTGNDTINMNNVTLANNFINGTGGGIFSSGVLNIKNSIIANNAAPNHGDCHITGTFNSQGNNLVENTTGCTISGNTTGNVIGIDPVLGTLSNQGGSTQVIPLLSGSPAIDAGNDATCMTTDQRGFSRPQGAHCDMGAFETGAGNFVVTKLADTNDNICDNDCSLREALAISLDGDTINFAAGLNGTITLNNVLGQIEVSNSITINGPGADKIAVSGNDLARVFAVSANKTVSISNLTVTHGYTFNDGGGAILNNGGNLTLNYVVISNSQTVFTVPSLGNGGGIYNYGTLTVKNSKIAYNISSQGGGIYNSAGSNLSLTDTVVEHNSSATGGGIYLVNPAALPDGAISLNRTSVTNNSATVGSGGIFLADSAIISNSLIANNTAGSLGSGAGGGITISEAGGLDAPVTITLTNVTISGNTAYERGGGMDVLLQQAADSVTLNYVTIADNQRVVLPGPPAVNGGGGIFAAGAESMDVKNSIIAGNTSNVGGADCEGALNSLDHNLIQNTGSCTINGTTTHNITGISANLETLGNNGGTTLTMKLQVNSPAIDAADDDSCPATDQRGFKRPQGAHCDMGAFESYLFALSSSTAINDGWTLESKELSNVASTMNNSGKLRAGDDALNRQYRSLLFFDTSKIPDNAVISKVMVRIYKSNVTGTDPFTTHGDLVADIKKGFFGLAPLQLTDFNAAAEPINTAGKFKDIGSNWHQLTLGSLNYKYINLFGATQFRIRFVKDDNNNKTADIALFDSGGDANPPQLIIEYSVP